MNILSEILIKHIPHDTETKNSDDVTIKTSVRMKRKKVASKHGL